MELYGILWNFMELYGIIPLYPEIIQTLKIFIIPLSYNSHETIGSVLLFLACFDIPLCPKKFVAIL